MGEAFDATLFRCRCTEQALKELLPPANSSCRAALSVIRLARQAEKRWAAEKDRIACAPGCRHCCQVHVATLEPEAALLAHRLRRKLKPETLQQLCARLDKLAVRIAGLDDEERLACRIPCPLLDAAGRCSIHPLRPLLCRAVTSTDAETCRTAISLAPIGAAPPILMHLRHHEIYQNAFLGLAEALERSGLDHRSRPLILFLREKLSESAG